MEVSKEQIEDYLKYESKIFFNELINDRATVRPAKKYYSDEDIAVTKRKIMQAIPSKNERIEGFETAKRIDNNRES